MRTKYRIYIIIALIFFSCGRKKEIIYYDTGEINKEIYLNNKLDTLKIITFSKNGDTIKITEFLNNNIIKVDIRNKLNDTVKIIRRVEYFKNKKRYGINFTIYEDSLLNQEGFFINGKLMGYTTIEKNGNTYEKLYEKKLNDSLAFIEGGISYDENNKIIEDSSFCYIVKGKSQIKKGEDYNFEIDLITNRFGIDSVFTGIELGTMDTNYTLSNIYYSEGGYYKKYKITIPSPEQGYNFIQGKIYLVGVNGNGNKLYYREMLFFYDFYVK